MEDSPGICYFNFFWLEDEGLHGWKFRGGPVDKPDLAGVVQLIGPLSRGLLHRSESRFCSMIYF